MGFFSQECHGCHMSILAPYHLTSNNRWMNIVVAIAKDGMLSSGFYDGYGRIDPDELDERTDAWWDACEDIDELMPTLGCTYNERYEDNHQGPTVWHQACWKAAGCPREWRGESPHASDQGFFWDDADYARRRPPKSAAGLARLAQSGMRLHARRDRETQLLLARMAKKGLA